MADRDSTSDNDKFEDTGAQRPIFPMRNRRLFNGNPNSLGNQEGFLTLFLLNRRFVPFFVAPDLDAQETQAWGQIITYFENLWGFETVNKTGQPSPQPIPPQTVGARQPSAPPLTPPPAAGAQPSASPSVQTNGGQNIDWTTVLPRLQDMTNLTKDALIRSNDNWVTTLENLSSDPSPENMAAILQMQQDLEPLTHAEDPFWTFVVTYSNDPQSGLKPDEIEEWRKNLTKFVEAKGKNTEEWRELAKEIRQSRLSHQLECFGPFEFIYMFGMVRALSQKSPRYKFTGPEWKQHLTTARALPPLPFPTFIASVRIICRYFVGNTKRIAQGQATLEDFQHNPLKAASGLLMSDAQQIEQMLLANFPLMPSEQAKLLAAQMAQAVDFAAAARHSALVDTKQKEISKLESTKNALVGAIILLVLTLIIGLSLGVYMWYSTNEKLKLATRKLSGIDKT